MTDYFRTRGRSGPATGAEASDGGGAPTGAAAPVSSRPPAAGGLARRSGPLFVATVLALAGVAFGVAAISRGGRAVVLVSSRGGSLTPGATIAVTGSGTVTGTPDTLNFEIGVHSTASSAAAALRQDDAVVSRLESGLEARGVPASGLQTSQLDIYPNEDSKQAITGFSVDDELSVTTHEISSAGAVIDAAARRAGNDVLLNGISFSISNRSALLSRARAAAVANARTEASEIAAGAGLTLGPVVRVTDQENSAPETFPGQFGVALPKAAGRVPVEVGTQPVSVEVSVVYSLVG